MLGLFLAACGSGHEDRARRPATSITHTPEAVSTVPPPPIEILDLGATAFGLGGEITVLNLRRSVDEGGESPPEGEAWLLFQVSVRNLLTEPEAFHIELVHADGRQFERARPPGVDLAFDDDILPEATVHGETAFLVPENMFGGILIYGLGEERWALELGLLPKDAFSP